MWWLVDNSWMSRPIRLCAVTRNPPRIHKYGYTRPHSHVFHRTLPASVPTGPRRGTLLCLNHPHERAEPATGSTSSVKMGFFGESKKEKLAEAEAAAEAAAEMAAVAVA